MVASLLSTKIQIPPLPARIVQRRRLSDALDRSIQPNCCLTLISAPAGYGKTTLLSAWAQKRDPSTAWLTLDESDNDPVRFMSYLLAALQEKYPALELPTPLEGQLSQGDIRDDLLIPLLNQMSRSPSPTCLILDDYHMIRNQNIHDSLGYLLENLPPQAHILIATRSDPALPMTRLRGRGQVNELRMEDLRFRQQEAHSFLETFSEIGLSSEDMATLTRRTEGWISGLQMAAASLRGHEDKAAFIKSFSGSHHYIMDYLLDEVLRKQSPHLQEFLFNTSILKRMCGPLCDILMLSWQDGGVPGSEVLKELERANLFIVPLDDERQWYRYHRLFADLLQERLGRDHPGRVPTLHRQASAWFEQHGLVHEAVDHALLSQDHAFAAELIERNSQETMMRSETLTFLHWLGRLPESEIQQRPKLGSYRAWALLFHGAPLSTIESQLQKGEGEDDPPGSLRTLQAFLTLCQGQIEQGLELAQLALEELPADEIYLRDFATLCVISARISQGELEDSIHVLEQTFQENQLSGNRAGAVIMLSEIAELRQRQLRLTEAQELYQRALAIATDEDENRLPVAGRALMGLGFLAFERYDLEEAERLVDEGIKLAQGWNLINTLDGHLTMAQIHAARDNKQGVEETLKTLKDIARRFDASEFDDLVVEFLEMNVKARQGELDAVQAWIVRRGLDHAPKHIPSIYHDNLLRSKLYRYELPILARVHIAKGRFEDALEALDELSARAMTPKRPYLMIEADILRAMIFQARGERTKSLEHLRRALEIALPQGLLRVFITEGETFLQLLKTGRFEWDSPDLVRFVDQILQKAGIGPSKDLSRLAGMHEALSAREIEVLALLPTGLTADELAENLVISVNTVRTHLKSIYAKLGVHSRHEAVAKATELDLF